MGITAVRPNQEWKEQIIVDSQPQIDNYWLFIRKNTIGYQAKQLNVSELGELIGTTEFLN